MRWDREQGQGAGQDRAVGGLTPRRGKLDRGCRGVGQVDEGDAVRVQLRRGLGDDGQAASSAPMVTQAGIDKVMASPTPQLLDATNELVNSLSTLQTSKGGATGRFQVGVANKQFVSISEIFDAEPPFTPRGCIAQAWSVAEVLRGLVKTKG